ncbi:MAG: hypothetical protein H6719_36350 [Sandaracinaceae bacterium]|nr:hypothetical protein [Sandaracinaceae bacterium]
MSADHEWCPFTFDGLDYEWSQPDGRVAVRRADDASTSRRYEMVDLVGKRRPLLPPGGAQASIDFTNALAAAIERGS